MAAPTLGLPPISEQMQRTLSLSVIMPAYNEERTLEEAIRRLLDVGLPCDLEVIVVDDGSIDATPAILASVDDPRMTVVTHRRNQGKGAAVRTGLRAATGTHVLIFDADLEYAATDIPELVLPILRGDAEVVYGARLFGQNTVHPSFRYAMGNRAMTFVANLLFDAYISDLHTCLKLVPLPFLRDLTLTESGFGLDTEITAELLRRGVRPFEVPVSYIGRSHAQGKKIDWRDGIICLRVLAKVRMRRQGKIVLPMPAASTPSGVETASLEQAR